MSKSEILSINFYANFWTTPHSSCLWSGDRPGISVRVGDRPTKLEQCHHSSVPDCCGGESFNNDGDAAMGWRIVCAGSGGGRVFDPGGFADRSNQSIDHAGITFLFLGCAEFLEMGSGVGKSARCFGDWPIALHLSSGIEKVFEWSFRVSVTEWSGGNFRTIDWSGFD